MKILKNLSFLIVLVFVVFFTGCQDQKENSLDLNVLEENSEQYASKTKAESDIEVIFYSYDEAGEKTVVQGNSSIGKEIDNTLNKEDRINGKPKTCCLIENLERVPPVFWPHEFRVDLGQAWKFDAISWVFRVQVYFNGDQISTIDLIDGWVGPRCDDIAVGLPFGFSVNNLEVGFCCPAEFEVVVTRMYRTNLNKRLYECSSESITYPYSGPRTGNPCC